MSGAVVAATDGRDDSGAGLERPGPKGQERMR
jgi:hypothetical protein